MTQTSINQDTQATNFQAAHQEAVQQTRRQQLRAVLLSMVTLPKRLVVYAAHAMMNGLKALTSFFRATHQEEVICVEAELIEPEQDDVVIYATLIEPEPDDEIIYAEAEPIESTHDEGGDETDAENLEQAQLRIGLAMSLADDNHAVAARVHHGLFDKVTTEAFLPSAPPPEEEILPSAPPLEALDNDLEAALKESADLAAAKEEKEVAEALEAIEIASLESGVEYDLGSEGKADVTGNTTARLVAVVGATAMAGLALYSVFGAKDSPLDACRAVLGIK
ncbi:MAG: hypothetical protein K0U24_02485 [Gammaproteobacteria bacterium]|nr:hypothetical protein [Gammaproteobacteria bacterium]